MLFKFLQIQQKFRIAAQWSEHHTYGVLSSEYCQLWKWKFSLSLCTYLEICHGKLLNCKTLCCKVPGKSFISISLPQGIRSHKRNVSNNKQTVAKEFLPSRKEGALHKDGDSTIPSILLIIYINRYLFLVSDIKTWRDVNVVLYAVEKT